MKNRRFVIIHFGMFCIGTILLTLHCGDLSGAKSIEFREDRGVQSSPENLDLSEIEKGRQTALPGIISFPPCYRKGDISTSDVEKVVSAKLSEHRLCFNPRFEGASYRVSKLIGARQLVAKSVEIEPVDVRSTNRLVQNCLNQAMERWEYPEMKISFSDDRVILSEDVVIVGFELEVDGEGQFRLKNDDKSSIRISWPDYAIDDCGGVELDANMRRQRKLRKGTIPPERIQQVLQKGLGSLSGCLDEAGQRYSIDFGVPIFSDMGVGLVVASPQTSLPRPTVTNCLSRKISEWKFGEIEDGDVVFLRIHMEVDSDGKFHLVGKGWTENPFPPYPRK